MGGVLLGLGLLAGLRVTAEGACPTAAAVEARLQQMLPQLQGLPPVHAHIEPIFELVRVEVRSEDGALLSVRDLPRTDPCADLAVAAAVAITSALLSVPRTPVLPPVIPPPRAPVPPLRRAAVIVPPPQVDVGVALALAAASSGATGAGQLVMYAAPPGQAWGARLGLSAAALRREALGADTGALWTRAQVELGPRYRVWPGRLLVDLHAQASAALLYVTGQGYAVDYQSWGWDVGLGGGLRVGLPLRWAMPWLGVAATGSLRAQELRVLGQTDSGRLPRFDVLLALGFSAGRWR